MADQNFFCAPESDRNASLPDKILSVVMSFFLLISVLGFVPSCTTIQSQSSFKAALQLNTFEAYRQFLLKFPESKEAPVAKDRIITLEKELAAKRTAELKRLKEWNLLRIEKIKGYGKGHVKISQEEFFADGWNPRDPFYGRLGIMGLNKSGEITEYEIGAMVVPEETQDSLADFAEGWFGYYREAQKNLNWRPILQKDESFELSFHKFCEISFKNNHLQSVTWSNEFLKTRQ